jgi:hypothetical protein
MKYISLLALFIFSSSPAAFIPPTELPKSDPIEFGEINPRSLFLSDLDHPYLITLDYTGEVKQAMCAGRFLFLLKPNKNVEFYDVAIEKDEIHTEHHKALASRFDDLKNVFHIGSHHGETDVLFLRKEDHYLKIIFDSADSFLSMYKIPLDTIENHHQRTVKFFVSNHRLWIPTTSRGNSTTFQALFDDYSSDRAEGVIEMDSYKDMTFESPSRIIFYKRAQNGTHNFSVKTKKQGVPKGFEIGLSGTSMAISLSTKTVFTALGNGIAAYNLMDEKIGSVRKSDIAFKDDVAPEYDGELMLLCCGKDSLFVKKGSLILGYKTWIGLK